MAEVKERPILFSAPMVRALLDGRKSQTRRIVKPGPPPCQTGADAMLNYRHGWRYTGVDYACERDLECCPYGTGPQIEFRPIPSTNGVYLAGSDGGIYRDGRRLKTWNGGYQCGYEMVAAGDQRKAYVHRLVAEAFYGTSPENLPEVRHLDGISKNNQPGNLDWGTREQNAADRSAHGHQSGERSCKAKLTDLEAAQIPFLKQSMTIPKVAKHLGISEGAVEDVLYGKTFKTTLAPPPNFPRQQFGKPGDRLWVRETWASAYQDGCWGTVFGADGAFVQGKQQHPKGPHFHAKELGEHVRWKPSIHMPRWASRITLEITEVRVQRLQEISPEDAKAEGSYLGRCDCPQMQKRETTPIGMSFHQTGCHIHGIEFKHLWESIHGEGSWAKNSWVWAVTFKVVS